MKIGILTFSKAPNYGALLQAYALSKILQNSGHQVVLINSDLLDQRGWKYKLRFLIALRNFRKFQVSYLPPFINKKYDSSIDLYIVGSDQVWNPELVVYPLDYFFKFLPADKRRISYAASFGMDTWKDQNMRYVIEQYLKKFDAISVREFSGKKICNSSFNVSAEVVLDPTLLLDSYESLTGNITLKNMLVSFKLADKKEWESLEYLIANDLNLNIKRIYRKKAIRYLPSFRGYISVPVWVKSIAESAFVLTDSYHAMIFAIIYRKPFAVFPLVKQRMGRVLYLLEKLGLTDRYYESIEDFRLTNKWKNEIDYKSVEIKLNDLRKKSVQFLANNIPL